MNRLLLLVMIVAMTLGFAGLAGAATTIRCEQENPEIPCYGTSGADDIFERTGDGVRDLIYGLGHGDVIDASEFNKDRDVLNGNGGNDRILTNDGDGRDLVRCGNGKDDVAVIDPGDSARRSCETVRVR